MIQPILYTLGDNTINGIIIKEKISDEELFEYKIIHREDFLEDLINWICEAKENDKILMKQDLKMLINISDEYILSSISTNHYLYNGCSEFNETCEELLKLNNSF